MATVIVGVMALVSMSDRPAGSERVPRRIGIAVAVVAAMTGGLSGCALVSGAPATGPELSSGPGFEHIHGLGVDPGEGDLFIATHNGVFRSQVDAGRAATTLDGPIAGNQQDTMGFTMVDGIMFGSGHPDPAGPDAELPALGLIVSSDQARTWDRVSLAGEADFHDIAAVGNASGGHDLYAYDGAKGAVRVSTDSGRTWSIGASILARDLTFDSENEILYATTEDGVAVSTDNGANFVADTGAPALYLIEALNDDSGGIVGVDLEGSVWLKTVGEGWQETGAVTGSVEAMTYSGVPTSSLVVADARGISTSNDFGSSWRTISPSE